MCAVLPSSSLIRFGILDARELHHDTVAALAGDLRVGDAGLVDAAAHDLDRLLHGGGRPLGQGDRGEGERDRAVRGRGEIEVGPARRALGARSSGRSAASASPVRAGSRSRSTTRFWSGWAVEGLVEDVARPQRLAHGVDQPLETFLDDRLHVHLEQQIAAAPQVEAEMDAAPGQPGGRSGDEVRDAEQHAEDADAQDERWS